MVGETIGGTPRATVELEGRMEAFQGLGMKDNEDA
jgi:hypothetical protein